MKQLSPGMAMRYCDTQGKFVHQLQDLCEWMLEPDCSSRCDSVMKLLDQMKHTQGMIRLWESRTEEP